MSSRPLGLSSEDLLRQDQWLRELVRRLVRESDVDDVVQETWASALRRGDRPLERPAAWLSVVAQNFARRAHRSVRRRTRREEVAARSEAVPSTEETLELLELQQQVVRAVAELSEPYRTTVLQRYTHGLSVKQIAARAEISEAGVRQRLKRGLDVIRADLRASQRGDWRDLPALAAWLIPGVVQMKKSTILVAAVLAVASVGTVGALVWRPSDTARETTHEPLDLIAAESVASAPPTTVIGQSEPEERAPVSIPEPVSTIAFAGRVLDARGNPFGGVGVAPTARYLVTIPAAGLTRPQVVTHTAADGTFRLESDHERGEVVTGPGWVPVASRSYQGGSDEALLIAAPAIDLGGVVIDSDGAALEGVMISIVDVQLSDFTGVLDGVQRLRWLESATNAVGRFDRRDLPAEMGRLRFEKRGYRAQEIAIGATDDHNVSVTLEQDEILYVVTGWVGAPNGAAVEGALVGLGDRTTRSARDGSFELRIPGEKEPGRRDALWAAQSPWRTRFIENVGTKLLEEDDKALEYELVFEGEALALGGLIVDVAGEPVEGVNVYIWRQRELATGRSAEELAVPEDRQKLHVGPGLRVWSITDAEGRFHLDGLLDTEYRLRLFDRERFAAWTTEPMRAGDENLVLTLPADFVRAEVTGRVVDQAGAGVAGATIQPQVGVYLSTSTLTSEGNQSKFVTDDEGRFRLTDVSGGDLMLSLHAESIMPLNHFLRDGDPVTDVEIVVDRRCHFRLVLTGERRNASGLQVLDAAGEPMTVAALGGGEYSWSTWRSFEGGRTRVLSVGQSAATLVLYDGSHQEVDRAPMALRLDDVNEIDW